MNELEKQKQEVAKTNTSNLVVRFKEMQDVNKKLLEALIEAKKILDSSPIKFSDVNAKVENAIKKATL